MRAGQISGAENWLLRDVRTERIFDRAVATLTFTREGHSLRAHLFPTHALATPYARIRHFDLYHLDDHLPDHEPAAEALLDGVLNWLDETLADARDVSFIDPSEPLDPPTPPAIASLLATLREQLPVLLATPPLAGWSLADLRIVRFRRLHVPRIDLAHPDQQSLKLFLLPQGTEKSCHFRTASFDMVYDDDGQGRTYTRNREMMEHIVAWLGDAFQPGESEFARRRTQRLQQLQATAEQIALANSIDAQLREAFASESLPELADWTFLSASVTGLRDDESPTIRFARDALDPSPRTHQPLTTIRLTRDDQTIALHLLPANTEPLALLRTDRFDIIYKDDAHDTAYDLNRTAILALVRWLGNAFQPGESELARRRTQRLQQLQPTAEQIALANSIDAQLREAFASESLPELADWTFLSAS
ncbi:MAG: hypothetical protein ACKO4Q_13550, partial [Planctomycetota bacterium]